MMSAERTLNWSVNALTSLVAIQDSALAVGWLNLPSWAADRGMEAAPSALVSALEQ